MQTSGTYIGDVGLFLGTLTYPISIMNEDLEIF